MISTVRSWTYATAFPTLLQNRSWPSIRPSVSSESISADGSCFVDSRMAQCLLCFVRPRPRTSTVGSRPPLDLRHRICFLLKALSTPLRLRSPRFSELRTPNGSVWGPPYSGLAFRISQFADSPSRFTILPKALISDSTITVGSIHAYLRSPDSRSISLLLRAQLRLT
jgi:hypothetical protein